MLTSRLIVFQPFAVSTPARSSPWGGASSMDQFAGGRIVNMDEEDEDPCIICHEELYLTNSTRLQCGHVFHENVSVLSKLIREYGYMYTGVAVHRVGSSIHAKLL